MCSPALLCAPFTCLLLAAAAANLLFPTPRLLAQALERITGLLEDDHSSLVIAERGDTTSVPRHPGFRLFAAMNPATDAGKRDLPSPLRNRFTEVWVAEPPQREDLAAIVAGYLAGAAAGSVDALVDFYLAAKAEAVSYGMRPLRTGDRPLYLCTAAESAVVCSMP